MKLSKFITQLLDKIFLLIPLLLFLFSLSSGLMAVFSGASTGVTTPVYAIWKFWMNVGFVFYELTVFVIVIFWLFQEKKTLHTFFRAFRNWFFGILLTFFSYALAGIVVDLGWLGYFVFLSLIKK